MKSWLYFLGPTFSVCKRFFFGLLLILFEHLNQFPSAILTKSIVMIEDSLIDTPMKLVTDIKLDYTSLEGIVHKIQLTPEVWQQQLLQGPHREKLTGIWHTHNQVLESRTQFRKYLKSNKNCVDGAVRLIKDFRSYQKDPSAPGRLENLGNPYFLGKPYFNEEQVDLILNIRTMKAPLENELKRIFEQGYTKGSFTCTAHSLSPTYEAAFGLYWDVGSRKVKWLNF